ncbi:serpin family protein [Candidatus Bathyarchaeota archaeon]|nr:serpin family protein [Candidatus Bathyarchaeota archaeon]
MFKRVIYVVTAFLFLIIGVGGYVYSAGPGVEVIGKVNIPVLDDSMATAESVQSTVDASNLFTFDLYGRYSVGGDNVFYSPYSISTALSMTYEGARGVTAEEMQMVFHWSDDASIRRPGAAKVYNVLNGRDRLYSLHTANALWMQDGYPFKEDYVDAVKDFYGGEANILDYSDPAEAADIINGWVEDRTNDKIKDLFSPEALVGARLVLTNAIYFKGDWVRQFDEEKTSKSDFHVTATETVEADMMRLREERFNYTDAGGCQVLELPYKGNDLSMIIVLPKGNDIQAFEGGLTLERYREWVSELRSTDMNIFLPKFRLETEYEMGNDLIAMGMPTAFSGGADFSGMSDGGLFISKVIHKAYVDVNEEGTEAAAATGVVMKESAPMLEVFRADHPFIFVIQDRGTGLVLFMGRVTDPS